MHTHNYIFINNYSICYINIDSVYIYIYIYILIHICYVYCIIYIYSYIYIYITHTHTNAHKLTQTHTHHITRLYMIKHRSNRTRIICVPYCHIHHVKCSISKTSPNCQKHEYWTLAIMGVRRKNAGGAMLS